MNLHHKPCATCRAFQAAFVDDMLPMYDDAEEEYLMIECRATRCGMYHKGTNSCTPDTHLSCPRCPVMNGNKRTPCSLPHTLREPPTTCPRIVAWSKGQPEIGPVAIGTHHAVVNCRNVNCQSYLQDSNSCAQSRKGRCPRCPHDKPQENSIA